MLVFEEVSRTFRFRLTVVTLVGTVTAVALARMILGSAPDFDVGPVVRGESWTLGLYFLFGGAVGLLGVAYNRMTIFFMDALESLRRWPPELRAGLVGALIGVVAWFSPSMVGGGDSLSQEILSGGAPMATLLLIVVVRWFVGPISYSAGTPGGLFSPLLLVGAGLGAIFATGVNGLVPAEYVVSPVAFAVVGMTAFFTGVVRAPFTGIVLIAEMTATSNITDAMLAAGFGAMLTSSLVRGAPIYDTLRLRMLAVLKKS